MGCTDDTASASGGNPFDDNPDDDILATLTGLIPVRCRVTPEVELDAVALDLRLKSTTTRAGRNLGVVQLLLAPPAALELAMRLAGTVERLRLEQQYGRGEYPTGEEG